MWLPVIKSGSCRGGQPISLEPRPLHVLVLVLSGHLEYILTLLSGSQQSLNKVHLHVGAISTKSQTPFAEDQWLFLGIQGGLAEAGNPIACVFSEPLCIQVCARTWEEFRRNMTCSHRTLSLSGGMGCPLITDQGHMKNILGYWASQSAEGRQGGTINSDSWGWKRHPAFDEWVQISQQKVRRTVGAP